jgi:adenine-specific DNA-methyltransferase
LPEQCEQNSEAFKAGFKAISDVSKERIRKVIKGIEQENAKPKQLGIDIVTNSIGRATTKGYVGKKDLGFKSFKLSPSNFKIWRGSEINEDNLLLQLDAFTNPIREGSEKDNLLYELMLKAGYLLTDKVEKIENFYSIKNSELLFALESINQATVDKMISLQPQKVISLDILFKDNDQLKTNTVLQMKDAGIDFKTI